ncbi:MAG: BrnT family toxin [Chloroflexi bacterium]|nr:BrnT family toxin [Chloroflexota bacterium]
MPKSAATAAHGLKPLLYGKLRSIIQFNSVYIIDIQLSGVLEDRYVTTTRWKGFDWDDGNIDKNLKHTITDVEIEEVFLNDARWIREGYWYYALGRSDSGRFIFVVFELRAEKIRPISAHEMTRSERRRYKKK